MESVGSNISKEDIWIKEVRGFEKNILESASGGEPWNLEFSIKEAKVDYLTLEGAENEIKSWGLFGLRGRREPERIQKFGPFYKSKGLTASVYLDKRSRHYGDETQEYFVPCLIIETDGFRALRLPNATKQLPAAKPAQPAQTEGKGF